jgi:ketosteroid isomerase-like protein
MLHAHEVEPRNDAEALALTFFTALVKKDWDAFGAIWHEDAVNEIPFTPEGLGRFVTSAFVGKQAIMDHYTVALKNRRDHEFFIDAVHQTADPNCVIIEAHARSVIGETGRVYENIYASFFEIRDGKVITLREYVNPLAVMRGFEGAFDEYH